MKRSIQAAIGALVVLAALLVAPVAANAFPGSCPNSWSSWMTTYTSPHWGQWRYCLYQENNLYFYQFQVQDIYTDGYSVHLEACNDYDAYYPYTCTNIAGQWSPTWGLIITDNQPTGDVCPQSSGTVETTQWPGIVAWAPGSGNPSALGVRLVRGRCEGGPYQNVASVSWELSGP